MKSRNKGWKAKAKCGKKEIKMEIVQVNTSANRARQAGKENYGTHQQDKTRQEMKENVNYSVLSQLNWQLLLINNEISCPYFFTSTGRDFVVQYVQFTIGIQSEAARTRRKRESRKRSGRRNLSEFGDGVRRESEKMNVFDEIPRTSTNPPAQGDRHRHENNSSSSSHNECILNWLNALCLNACIASSCSMPAKLRARARTQAVGSVPVLHYYNFTFT